MAASMKENVDRQLRPAADRPRFTPCLSALAVMLRRKPVDWEHCRVMTCQLKICLPPGAGLNLVRVNADVAVW